MVARVIGNDIFSNLSRTRSISRAGVKLTAPAPGDVLRSLDNIELSEYRIRTIVREELAAALAEIAELRAALTNTLNRLSLVEFQRATHTTLAPLFAPTAPVMELARTLCAEIFPGPLTIEVACAPDDPSAQWYVFHVFCAHEMHDCLDREAKFGLRLHTSFPEEAGDIRLAVSSP